MIYYNNDMEKKKAFKDIFEKGIDLENLTVMLSCLGSELVEIIVNTGEDAYCNEIIELELEFSNGKEWRIYINNETKKLTVYGD